MVLNGKTLESQIKWFEHKISFGGVGTSSREGGVGEILFTPPPGISHGSPLKLVIKFIGKLVIYFRVDLLNFSKYRFGLVFRNSDHKFRETRKNFFLFKIPYANIRLRQIHRGEARIFKRTTHDQSVDTIVWGCFILGIPLKGTLVGPRRRIPWFLTLGV